jgi:rSAM/selenodomain-associated transferase 1
MAKVPAAGRVKTRLARALGVATATRFARHATAAVLARLGRHPAWQTTLAIAPDTGTQWLGWPRGTARVPQGSGDLGQRMQRIMDRTSPGPVVIIGTDVPGIRIAHIREAFSQLGRHDAVVGPATDGGYWLIGLRRRPRVLKAFGGVRWSSPHALTDTLANLGGRSVARIATLSDVDTAQDFARSAAGAGYRVEGMCIRNSTVPDSGDRV